MFTSMWPCSRVIEMNFDVCSKILLLSSRNIIFSSSTSYSSLESAKSDKIRAEKTALIVGL